MKDVLGYSQSDSKLFHKNIVNSLIDKIPTKSEITSYGIKHTYNITLIEKDHDRITHKIVTVYPDKKGDKK